MEKVTSMLQVVEPSRLRVTGPGICMCPTTCDAEIEWFQSCNVKALEAELTFIEGAILPGCC